MFITSEAPRQMTFCYFELAAALLSTRLKPSGLRSHYRSGTEALVFLWLLPLFRNIQSQHSQKASLTQSL